MKRRRFLSAFAAAGAGAAFRPLLGATGQGPAAAASGAGADAAGDVVPYFLGSLDLSDVQRRDIEEYVRYQELVLDGKEAIMPRGGRPPLAPSYRFLKWEGRMGDTNGRFVGPLSVRPVFSRGTAFAVNAQSWGFRTSSTDFPGKAPKGTLSIEFRARMGGEPLTWLYAEQFQTYANGATSLGQEYVAQRDGAPRPVITDEPNIDIRIQLMRHRERVALLNKILKICSTIVQVSTGNIAALSQSGGGGDPYAQARPVIRVPQLFKEGVAFSQALFGGMAEEAPLWRSGFTSYGIAQGGSRLVVSPGLWIAVDETREPNLRGVTVADLGGRVGLTRDGAPLDINYLALQLEIKPAEAPGSTVYLTQPAPDASAQEAPQQAPEGGITIRHPTPPPPPPDKK